MPMVRIRVFDGGVCDEIALTLMCGMESRTLFMLESPVWLSHTLSIFLFLIPCPILIQRVGDVTQLIEYLPSMHKALCSNPSTTYNQAW